MRDVVQVVAEFDGGFIGAGRIALLHLGPAGQAGAHQVAVGVAGHLLGKLLHKTVLLGARADQAHVPHQHVEQLRNLIEPGAANPMPEARDARVVGLGELGGELRFVAHAAELPDPETLAMHAGAPLAEQGRTGRVDLDTNRHPQRQRQPQRQQGQHHAHIDEALGQVVRRVAIGLPQLVLQGLGRHAPGQALLQRFGAVQADVLQLERGQKAVALGAGRG